MTMTTIEAQYPLRFRSVEEFYSYREGKVSLAELVQPGTPEYEDAPYQVSVVAHTQ
jgi:hypothetical protein